MNKLTVGDARKDLADALNRVAYGGERIVIHRRGKDVAALVSVEDLRLIEKLEDEMDIAAAREALAEAKERGTIPLEQVEAELGLTDAIPRSADASRSPRARRTDRSRSAKSRRKATKPR